VSFPHSLSGAGYVWQAPIKLASMVRRAASRRPVSETSCSPTSPAAQNPKIEIGLGAAEITDVDGGADSEPTPPAIVSLQPAESGVSWATRNLGFKFPDTGQKFLVLQNLFPDNSRRELREKSLRHSGFLPRNPSR